MLGFSREKLHFALVLDKNGKLVRVCDIRVERKNKMMPRSGIVPSCMKKRASGIDPNYMWDNTGYVLGRDNKNNPDRTKECHLAFVRQQHEIGDDIDDPGMKAVLMYLDNWRPDDAEKLDYWEDMIGQNIVFQLEGEKCYIHDHPQIKKRWLEYILSQEGLSSFCLVSGQRSSIARLHPSIKGVKGAQSSGAALSSFNAISFESYGKEQNYNAPISQEIAFAYTTALNYLLSWDSRQKIQLRDTTTVFWSEGSSHLEECLKGILDPSSLSEDLTEIRSYLEALSSGGHHGDSGSSKDRFYVLGLSPNASRLSVRFWHVSSISEMESNLCWHFKDLSIIRSYKDDPEFPSLWQLLKETAPQGKTDNISPLLSGAVLQSIFTGALYPSSLLSAVLSRIRADQRINYLRAALIKAFLNRSYRIKKVEGKEVSMSLNVEEKDVGYLLGRLFAVFEKAQKDALPDINTTIKDRFYGSASATPKVVFPQLFRLNQYHLQKSKYGFVLDRLAGEIMQKISSFPSHLSLESQGMFALGYYHQKQALYQKKEKEEE